VSAQQRCVLPHPEPEHGQADQEEGHGSEGEPLGVGQRGHGGLGAHHGQDLERLPGHAAAERDPQRRVRTACEEREAQRTERPGRAPDDDGGLADGGLAKRLGEASLLLATAGDQLSSLDEPQGGESGLEGDLVGDSLGEERPAHDQHPHRAGLLVRAEEREGEEQVRRPEGLAGLSVVAGAGDRVGVQALQSGGRLIRSLHEDRPVVGADPEHKAGPEAGGHGVGRVAAHVAQALRSELGLPGAQRVGGDECSRRAPQPERQSLQLRPAPGEAHRDHVRPALGVDRSLVHRLVAEGRRGEGEVREPENERWQREQKQLDAGHPLPFGASRDSPL
jgi:hypothetical protein